MRPLFSPSFFTILCTIASGHLEHFGLASKRWRFISGSSSAASSAQSKKLHFLPSVLAQVQKARFGLFAVGLDTARRAGCPHLHVPHHIWAPCVLQHHDAALVSKRTCGAANQRVTQHLHSLIQLYLRCSSSSRCQRHAYWSVATDRFPLLDCLVCR